MFEGLREPLGFFTPVKELSQSFKGLFKKSSDHFGRDPIQTRTLGNVLSSHFQEVLTGQGRKGRRGEGRSANETLILIPKGTMVGALGVLASKRFFPEIGIDSFGGLREDLSVVFKDVRNGFLPPQPATSAGHSVFPLLKGLPGGGCKHVLESELGSSEGGTETTAPQVL